MDWSAVEEAYIRKDPFELAFVDDFLTEGALSILLDMARASTMFVDNRCGIDED